MMSIFHIFDADQKRYYVFKPASMKDRVIAQLIDGIFLGVVCSGIFYVMSDGAIFSVWVAPIFPEYILEITKDYPADISDFWWGGYYASFQMSYGKTIYVNYPAPLLIGIYIAYYAVFTTIFGQTPGKMLKKIVVLDRNKELLKMPLAVLRWGAYLLSLLPLGAGLWKTFQDEYTPVWHDLLSKSFVYAFD